jgi:hypothetical protein
LPDANLRNSFAIVLAANQVFTKRMNHAGPTRTAVSLQQPALRTSRSIPILPSQKLCMGVAHARIGDKLQPHH